MRLLTALAVTVVSIAITVVVVVVAVDELSFFLAYFCSNLGGGYR